MCSPSRTDTGTSHSVSTGLLVSSLVSGPATSLSSGSDAFALGQFSMDLHELEVVHALQSLSQVSETQLNTEEHMHELLEVDSEVTFRKVMGSAVVLPTRPSVDLFEVTRPIASDWSGSASTPSDWSGLQLTPTTSRPVPRVSLSVVAPRASSGSDTSHIFRPCQTLHSYLPKFLQPVNLAIFTT